eukprot:Pgem_evm1s11599
MHECEIDKSAIGKWFDVISEYSFHITHVPRENNEHADLLSKVCSDAVNYKNMQRINSRRWNNLASPQDGSIDSNDVNSNDNNNKKNLTNIKCVNCAVNLVKRNNTVTPALNKKEIEKINKINNLNNNNNKFYLNTVVTTNDCELADSNRLSVRLVQQVSAVRNKYYKSTYDWKLRSDLFEIADQLYGTHT